MPPSITGQLFIRHMGEMDGKPLVAVAGVLTFPKDDMPPNEHQLVVAGIPSSLGDSSYALTIFKDGAIDRKSEAAGLSLGQVVYNPWWRI